LEVLELLGALGLEPGQDVQSHSAVVSSGFDEVVTGEGFQAAGEFGSQQLPEERAYADAGVVVALASRTASFLFVVSKIWTVEGPLHELGEGNYTGLSHVLAEHCRNCSH
jgi:hypothetical protein